MDVIGKATVIRRIGAAAHFFGILAGASAVYALFTDLGRFVSYNAAIGWGLILYRLFLCLAFAAGGLFLGRLAERMAAGGDAERARASEAERTEADRLTRQIGVPARRNRSQ
ncbi:MAG: hypothetical protein GX161_01755 [Firmicutes bacterium]|nr:hypothetical protein [Bacillota bacterium]